MLHQNAVPPSALGLKKISALRNLNSRKDYWVIATLLRQYSREEMLKIFKTKFPQIDIGFIIHSLTDFEKADTGLDPDSYTCITWDEIKLLLTNEVRKHVERLLEC